MMIGAALLILFGVLLAIPKVFAVCPVCTVAVGAGVGVSRFIGIDDTITGIWIGALIVSSALWVISWIDKKNIKVRFRSLLVLASFYLVFVLPHYLWGFIGGSCDLLFGFDELLLGIIVGSFGFAIAVFLNKLLKEKNNGRVYFSYQKVVIPVLSLVIFSVIFYFMTGC